MEIKKGHLTFVVVNFAPCQVRLLENFENLEPIENKGLISG